MITNEGRGLGRLYIADRRDFRMAALLPGRWPITMRRHWTIGPVLDQGRTSSCVGHAWRQFLLTTPLKTTNGPSPLDLYYQAKLIDEWPENDHTDTGTSVRAGVKILERSGHIRSYAFAWTLDEIVKWVLTKGPVVVGTAWHQMMSYPDNTGLIVPQGYVVGGHCYMMYGIDRQTQMCKFVNSWGIGWGLQGKFTMSFDSLQLLLNEQGEACTAMERMVVSA